MRVSTPTISWHNRERVSSLDFQPTPYPGPTPSGDNGGGRLATGGDDKHVVIWEISTDHEGKVEPLCLCDLSRHQNSVNIVRWSSDGQLLASGDTDSAIYLWQFDSEEAPPDIFDSDSIKRENWKVSKILRGHLQDVIGLSWSPCSSFLLSCSTDGTAIVFDVKKGSKCKMLSDHKGWVNGVAWDPLNKYVASIASDRCLRVFTSKGFRSVARTKKSHLKLPNWEEEKVVRLFHDDTFMSFYRRMDFSPDGELLVVPSGVLGVEGDPKVSHCSFVFSTRNFAKPALCLPGKEFSVCVRFSPIKYRLRPTPRSEPIADDPKEPWQKFNTLFCLPYRMVYAVATQNTILFYDTQQAEPFARISKIHYIGLNDLSWSLDGLNLVVASTDGFCSIVNFKANDLGEVYDENSDAETPKPVGNGDKLEPATKIGKKGHVLNNEGVSSPHEIKIRSVKEGGRPNPKRLQLITLSSPAGKKPEGSNAEESSAAANEVNRELVLEDTTPSPAEASNVAASREDVGGKTATAKKRVQLITLT